MSILDIVRKHEKWMRNGREGKRPRFDYFISKAFVALHIPEADFTDAVAVDCVFRECDLSRASFAGTSIQESRFYGCNLAGADFSESCLRRVKFYNCLMDGARFRNANASLVMLEGCSLVGVNVREGDFTWATGEKLRGVSLMSLGVSVCPICLGPIQGCLIDGCREQVEESVAEFRHLRAAPYAGDTVSMERTRVCHNDHGGRKAGHKFIDMDGRQHIVPPYGWNEKPYNYTEAAMEGDREGS